MAIFSPFFQAIQARKMSFTIFQYEKTPFQPIKTKVKKWKNGNFFKRVNPWFWSKNGHFSNFSFRQYRPAKFLLRYSRTKKGPFQAIKTRSSKRRKIDIFPKGLTHSFCRKIAIFSNFFLKQYRPENFFYDILERKNAFQGYKYKNFKKSKN